MNIIFGIIITVLSVIGLKTVFSAVYDSAVSGARCWNARILVSVMPTGKTPVEQLVYILEYVKAKYMPEMEICVLCSEMNKTHEPCKDEIITDSQADTETK